MKDFLEQKPDLVLENIFAAAVPVLVKHVIKVTDILSEENETVTSDSIIEAAQCLKFLSTMMCNPDTFGGRTCGRVTRKYLEQMAQAAKTTFIRSECPVELKVGLFRSN